MTKANTKATTDNRRRQPDGRPYGLRPYEARKRAADLSAQGKTVAEIALAIGIAVKTAYAWRKKDKWLVPQPVATDLQNALQSGQQAPANATALDPRGAAVLVQHRAQLDRMRRRMDELIDLPDLGAGLKGSIAQAIERATAALARMHDLDRKAFGIEDRAAGHSVAVIVVPARARDISAWAKEGGVQVDGGPRKRRASRPARVIEDAELGELERETSALLAGAPVAQPDDDRPADLEDLEPAGPLIDEAATGDGSET